HLVGGRPAEHSRGAPDRQLDGRCRQHALRLAGRGDALCLHRPAAAAVPLRGLHLVDRAGAARRLAPPPVQLLARVTRRRARRPAQPAGLGDATRWLRLPRRRRRTDRPPRSARARVGLSVTMTIASVLAGSYLIDQPSIQLPFITNRWAVGIFFLIHIIFGSFTMGALVLGPTYEWIGLRREDPRYERLARSLGNVNLKIFSLGATLGGFAVIVLTALYPTFFVTLITVFFWPAVVAFSIWFLTLGGILLYNLRWDRFRLRKGTHILIGYATAATEHIFLFIIVALDSYLLTPRAGQGLSAFFNPSYWPELGYRFGSNLYFWQSRSTAAGPILTALVAVASLITMTPAALYPKGMFWLRYVALGGAVLLSLLHWLLSRPRTRTRTPELRRSSQVTLAV